MKRIITTAIPFALVLAASGPPALAQGTPGKVDAGRATSMGYEVAPGMQRYREMAGLTDRPSMNDPEIRKQTEEMRKQMDSMMRSQP